MSALVDFLLLLIYQGVHVDIYCSALQLKPWCSPLTEEVGNWVDPAKEEDVMISDRQSIEMSIMLAFQASAYHHVTVPDRNHGWRGYQALRCSSEWTKVPVKSSNLAPRPHKCLFVSSNFPICYYARLYGPTMMQCRWNAVGKAEGEEHRPNNGLGLQVLKARTATCVTFFGHYVGFQGFCTGLNALLVCWMRQRYSMIDDAKHHSSLWPSPG